MKGRLLLRLLPVGIVFLLLVTSILAESSSLGKDSPLGTLKTDAAGSSSELSEELTGTEDLAKTESSDEQVAPSDLAEEPVELLLNGGEGARLHLYNGEETAVFSYSGGRRMATMADSTVTHRIYDKAYRLKSKLTWQELGGFVPTPAEKDDGDEALLEPPQLVSQEDYYYYEDSSSYQRVVLTDFQETSRTERFFSPEGLLVREEFYQFVLEDDSYSEEEAEPAKDATAEEAGALVGGTVGEASTKVTAVPVTDLPLDPWKDFPQLMLTGKTEYQYNEGKALVEKVTTRREGEESFSQRLAYHQPGNIHGGYDEFEDGQLLVSRKYDDENQYTETRYMDGMRIEAIYNGARLVSETIYLDGKELRRTEY